ncbi:hypothetical protein EJB05_07466 [Eragrostis curvula]|uniref:MD-2-related lipid-recognition domain-containing protein n=1 Tax=Eragrostis curvula TaxID=38414 RepID=A0A5J9WGN9_9POAL|nr:hypothetical protein EJB05_07466 [Eragrostis curvula]
MGRFQRGTAAVVVVSLLLFLACDVSGNPSSSAASKVGHHAPAHIRKLLGTSKVTLSDCDNYVVVVSQDDEGPVPGPPGLHHFHVTISNEDTELTVCDVHISCGDLLIDGSVPVDPFDFRLTSPGNCIVKNGDAMAPGDTINFDYSSYAPIPFEVISFSCCPPA